MIVEKVSSIVPAVEERRIEPVERCFGKCLADELAAVPAGVPT